MAPATTEHFIVGDFIVVDVRGEGGTRGLRFDERFQLKEDYDFTAQHLEALLLSSFSFSTCSSLFMIC